MIQYVHGDILLSTSPVIAHGVAPNDDFHTGLALQLREQFPAMYKDFRHYAHVGHPKAGDFWVWSGTGPHGSVRIASLFTQEGSYEHGGKPGRAHTEHVHHALKKLAKWVESERPASIALPRLATGVGGLEWTAVEPLIQQHLANAGAPVFVYTTYAKGVAAPELGGVKSASR